MLKSSLMGRCAMRSIFAAVMVVLCSSCQDDKPTQADREIIKRVSGVKSTNSIENIVKYSEDIHLISVVAKNNISDNTIEKISSLVSSDVPVVKYWSAMSLGEIGHRARRYVPILYDNLKKVQCAEGQRMSASGIRYALRKLGEKPVSPNC